MKSVYGPVKSWRFGQSLGIDPILETSTCSFDCIYCQLGKIQRVTNERKIYVSTEKVIQDFKEVLSLTPIDVITYSGSGEPTLAENLYEIITAIRKEAPKTPQFILTNATTLHHPEVQKALQLLDKVIVKLDATDDETLKKINRPHHGITVDQIIQGILEFKATYQGELELQTMLMPKSTLNLQHYIQVLNVLRPSVVQLNTPTRPYPLSWRIEHRGNHTGKKIVESRDLSRISKEELLEIEERIRRETKLSVLTIYSRR